MRPIDPLELMRARHAGSALGHLVATVIIVLVFMPLSSCRAWKGGCSCRWASPTSSRSWLDARLGDVTPVMAFYLLPRMKQLDHGDPALVQWLKAR